VPYTAVEIIALRDRELAAQSNFRNLWQETADLVFPRENQITDIGTPGEDKSRKVYDPTAILDSQEMASGLSSALIPTGQEFFGLKSKDARLDSNDTIRRYLSRATEVTHQEMFESNFMLQWNESLRGLAVFGTCNLYCEWDVANGALNYKDYPISSYQILEDNHGNVDTVILTFTMTAHQAIQEFGEAKVSEKIREADKKPETSAKTFEFIQLVGPRKARNPRFEDMANMAWESYYVDVAEKSIIDEGGFERFPFAVARWMKGSSEKYGRGQGTEILSAVKVLQAIMRDLTDCANRWVNPPREVAQNFEGRVNVTPGAVNYVPEVGNTIKALDQGMMGNFPVTEKMLELQREVIHKAFYRDIFGQLSSLTGDRRTTTEIIERIREGLRRLAMPVSRIESELLTPTIERSVWLLIRNGRIPYPPPELAGVFGIEYLGELGLALRNQQAKGFVQWVSVVANMAPIFPEAVDLVGVDKGVRRLAETSGVNIEDVASEDEVAVKRQARQQAQAAAQALEAAESAGKAYGPLTKKAEDGSAAAELMGAMKE
jgi:hypothetical protein